MSLSIPMIIGVAVLIGIALLMRFQRGGAGRRDSLEGRPRDLGQVPRHMQQGTGPLAPPDIRQRTQRTHRSGSALAAPPSRTFGSLSPEADAEVRLLLDSGKKIAAIKVVRQSTGMNLKDAKEFVEALR